ncbi:MAG: metallophosphoesterase family protein [Candidatus Aenigmatarchaeota archaeon]
MRVLVASDIHNDVENIISYTDKISMLNFDVIVIIGDFTDYNIPRGFTAKDIGELIIEEFKTFKKPILAIPGNFDKELIEVFEKMGINLHAKGRVIDNVGFYGFGGARTPFNTSLEPSEEEIKNGLRNGFEKVKNCEVKIQVTHMPPFNTKVDVAYTGAHIGSEAVREFIEKFKPNVAVCAHVHEAKGLDEIGTTKIINAGRFPEGYCGIIDIVEGKTEVKIINLI